MATYKAEHLKEMIRLVVRQEIKDVVSGVIAEVISERYLRKLAESAVSARPRGVADLSIMGDEEEPDEEVPHALANHVLGVGQENPVFKKVKKPNHVRQHNEGLDGRDRNKTLSLFFEGTAPLAQRERRVGMYHPDLFDEDGRPRQLQQLAEQEEPEFQQEDDASPEEDDDRVARRPITEVWQALAGTDKIEEQVQAQAIDPAARMKLEEARLKRQRDMLEVKVG